MGYVLVILWGVCFSWIQPVQFDYDPKTEDIITVHGYGSSTQKSYGYAKVDAEYEAHKDLERTCLGGMGGHDLDGVYYSNYRNSQSEDKELRVTYYTVTVDSSGYCIVPKRQPVRPEHRLK